MRLNRRSVLSKIAYTGGIVAGNNTVSSDSEFTEKIHFIELGLRYKIVNRDLDSNLTTYHDCIDKPYRIYQGTLYIDSSRITNETKDKLQNESTLIYSKRFMTPGSNLFNSKNRDTLPTQLSPDHQSNEGIMLSNPIRSPDIKLHGTSSSDSESVEITVDSDSDTVSKGIMAEHQLASIKADAETRRKHRATEKEKGRPSWSYGSEGVKAIPEVITRNYGKIPIKWRKELEV